MSSSQNYEDLTDDAAISEWMSTYSTLVFSEYVTPEDIHAAVDGLLDTLNNCVTKSSTLDDMIDHVMEIIADDQHFHYASGIFLADVALKFTMECEGRSFAKALTQRLESLSRTIADYLASFSEASATQVYRERNRALFFADLLSRISKIEPMKLMVVPLLLTYVEVVAALSEPMDNIPRDVWLENAQAAVHVMKLAAPSVDEVLREVDIPERWKKVRDYIPNLYNGMRNMLITSNDLSPSIRAGIIRILELRASRWGEVPSADKPFNMENRGVDEVDPNLALTEDDSSANVALTEEETQFFNEAMDALELQEQYDEITESNGYYEAPTDDQQYGDFDRRFPWQSDMDQIPDAMAEFRNLQASKQNPGASGDGKS